MCCGGATKSTQLPHDDYAVERCHVTCIVGLIGKKGVLLAGDAQSSTQWIKREDTQGKVFQLSPVLAIGYCGSGRLGQILQHHLMDALDDPPLGMDEHRWIVRDFIPYLRDVVAEHGHLHVYLEDNTEGFGPSEILFAVRGRLFTVDCEFGISEHLLAFEATGSGAETAMGSIHGELGDRTYPLDDRTLLGIATRGIRAAEKLTNYVGGKITTVKTVRFTADEKQFARGMLRK